MNSRLLTSAVGVAALLLVGCLPEEYIWWSPDGQTAAVRAPAGLRLADTNGQLSAVILPGDIQSAAWLPDGSSLVVSRSFKLTNWAAVERLISPEEAAETKQMARAIPDLLKAGLAASGGSLDDLGEKFIEPLGMMESRILEPAWLCALSLHRERVRAALAGATNAAAIEAEIHSSETNGIPIYEISILSMRDGRPVGKARALVRRLIPLLDPVPSPCHSTLAFRTGEGALEAMTLDGKSSLVVEDKHAVSAAWSADGRALIHVVMGRSDKVGEIRSRAVVGDRGELLQNPPPVDTLAIALFASGASTRLSALPDGRLLFASVPAALPSRAASIQPGARFFLLDPAKHGTALVPVEIKEGALPNDLSAFSPSPDGRFVAVVDGGSDGVVLIELATGKAQTVSPSHPGWKSRMIPSWKNNHELTFAGLPLVEATRPELLVWRADMPGWRVLSKDWPDNVVKAWLEAPRSDIDTPQK